MKKFLNILCYFMLISSFIASCVFIWFIIQFRNLNGAIVWHITSIEDFIKKEFPNNYQHYIDSLPAKQNPAIK